MGKALGAFFQVPVASLGLTLVGDIFSRENYSTQTKMAVVARQLGAWIEH